MSLVLNCIQHQLGGSEPPKPFLDPPLRQRIEKQ